MHLYFSVSSLGVWLMCRHGDGTIEAVGYVPFVDLDSRMMAEIQHDTRLA